MTAERDSLGSVHCGGDRTPIIRSVTIGRVRLTMVPASEEEWGGVETGK